MKEKKLEHWTFLAFAGYLIVQAAAFMTDGQVKKIAATGSVLLLLTVYLLSRKLLKAKKECQTQQSKEGQK